MRCLTELTSVEILPISVSLAVATTTPLPLPLVTAVEAKAILSWSAKAMFSPSSFESIFSTELDSPVKADSWIRRLSESMIRRSAGTLSPASKKTVSPTTKSSAGTSFL